MKIIKIIKDDIIIVKAIRFKRPLTYIECKDILNYIGWYDFPLNQYTRFKRANKIKKDLENFLTGDKTDFEIQYHLSLDPNQLIKIVEYLKKINAVF
jgi:hypothetical protein